LYYKEIISFNIVKKEMKQYIIKPIGIIRTPHKDRDKTPIQPRFAFDIIGKIELFQEYTDG